MTTTQRSESMNALFKMWVTTHTSIYKFVCRIDNIIENICQREGDEDMRTMNEDPPLWSKFPLELDARRVYTRKAFSVFKELLKDSCLSIVKEIARDQLYEVEIKDNPDFKHWVPVSYLVKVDKEAELYSCNCKGFEFEGLLCPHAMKVMWIHGIQHLPSHYILKRWCRDSNANIKRPVNERSRDGNSLALQMFRATTLKVQFSQLVDLASKDAQSFNLVEGKLNELLTQVQPLQLEDLSKIPEYRASNEESVKYQSTIHVEDDVVFRDPPISKCKGRKKRPLRWKTAVEKAPIKGRTCSYCGIMSKHNIRTCPKKLEDQGRGKKVDGEDVDGEEHDEEEDYEEEDDEEDYE
ncbi:Protein FAR1-RELATED SEQUENCE 5 [Rhynchospora pubera]|uniref:Protein FAR1-RELATED SEQUENCE n=1 Tax=Rhynchospora pubera TaxID=906938 RepID=A0AAV8BQ68_9POAL|nr:Protein FAR1-RELATED SEQUENCE 5 [Rhynchospora pubera]